MPNTINMMYQWIKGNPQKIEHIIVNQICRKYVVGFYTPHKMTLHITLPCLSCLGESYVGTWLLQGMVSDIDGILPKGPYLPCVSMAGRALSAGYHRYGYWQMIMNMDQFPSLCWLKSFGPDNLKDPMRLTPDNNIRPIDAWYKRYCYHAIVIGF